MLADRTCVPGVSLHHVVPRRPHLGDDVEANLVFLCGDGTTGHHGEIEHRKPKAQARLNEHIREHRPDIMGYVYGKFGGGEGDAWLDRRYPPET